MLCTLCKLELTESDFYAHNHSTCKSCIRQKVRQYKAALTPEQRRDIKRRYKEQHPETFKAEKARNNKRRHQRKLSDPAYKLMRTLRKRHAKVINKALSSGQTCKSLTAIVGCTAEELKVWFEAKFKPGMTWENRGEWEVDHIVPLSWFNLEDPNEQLKAGHYTNLQPLWKEENRAKSNHYAG
jgi:hypothetical protein